MKKSAIAVSMVMALSSTTASAAAMTTASFDMATPGGVFFAPDTTVTGSIGGGTWSVASPTPFFGVAWTATGGTTFASGTYTIDTIEGGVYTGIQVGAGQVGGHILFNWGTSLNIDVVNVWDVTEASLDASNIEQIYTSTDVTVTAPAAESLDGIPGLSMIDGPFGGYNANFNFKVKVLDTTAPVITLAGANPQSVVVGPATYNELGATCTDASPQQLRPTALAIDALAVDTTVIGNSFNILYDCTDTNLNAAVQVSRTVNVVAPNSVTTLLGTTPVAHECDSGAFTYVDDGAQCVDPIDGNITNSGPTPPNLVLTGVPFDTTTPGGTFNLAWTCTNTAGDIGSATRVVNVVDTLSPAPGLITINDTVSTLETPTGPLYFETNDIAGYVDPTLEAVTDACDLTVPALAARSGTVETTLPAGVNVVSSTLTFAATDASGNAMTFPLEVQVRRSEPVIVLLGDTQMVLNVGDAYVEPGMDITDQQDGDLTAVITSGTTPGVGAGATNLIHNIVIHDSSSNVVASVDTSVNGARYTITYDVTDSDGNVATQIVRTVNIGAFAVGSNFTMLDAQGNVFGGTNDVLFDWDQSTNTDQSNYLNNLNFNMSIVSQQPFPFFGFVWTAHHTRVFGPGTYSFDSGCTVAEIVATGCPAGSAANSGPSISMTIPVGYLGAHILFDWNTTANIDVVNVWEIGGVWEQHGDVNPRNQLYNGLAGAAPDPATTWKLVSTDANGDLVNGSPMVDGPFQDFYANFNAGPGGTAPPPEPYTGTAVDTDLGDSLLSSLNLWSLLAGLVALVGLRGVGRRQHQ